MVNWMDEVYDTSRDDHEKNVMESRLLFFTMMDETAEELEIGDMDDSTPVMMQTTRKFMAKYPEKMGFVICALMNQIVYLDQRNPGDIE